ncbi:MAG: carbohydrate ABC transporter permease, partial [Bacilli bacterium]
MKGKIVHILKAVASGVIWGLGQIFNRQYWKALFFFVFFAILFSIEIGTSRYISGYSPYEKIPGVDLNQNFVNRFVSSYKADVFDGMPAVASFDTFYNEHKDNDFTPEEFIQYLAINIKDGSKVKYYVLAEELQASEANKGKDRLTDLIPNEDDDAINTLTGFNVIFTTYQDVDGDEYYKYNQGTSTDPSFVYINANDENDILTANDIATFDQLDRPGNIYVNSTYTKFYNEVSINKNGDLTTLRYDNIIDNTDRILKSDAEASDLTKIPKITDALYYSDTTVYGYFNPEGRGGKYRSTAFSAYVSQYFVDFQSLYKTNTPEDFAKFKLRIYFEINPDIKMSFEETYDNFFNDRAGFFIKGIWSIFTLGTAAKNDFYQIDKLSTAIDVSDIGDSVLTNLPIKGHISSDLLIRGLISTLLLFYFVIVYVWNIHDAFKTSKQYSEDKIFVKDKEYFKKMYESSFEYIVLLPALFVLTFISIMPILFGFLIAFTSYNGNMADVGLFDWVGFKNFVLIFNFGANVGIPFGQIFWRVFSWTVIWAIFSTATCFFGGFFQAVIINSERVPLKKFWRTLLILPWAVPAIISQMVFANFFNESGVVNAFLQKLGVYKILNDWGMLGQTIEEFLTGTLPKLFYLGNENIQWFTNPHNPWFVRIVLIVVNIWLGFPYFMALMTGIMVGI